MVSRFHHFGKSSGEIVGKVVSRCIVATLRRRLTSGREKISNQQTVQDYFVRKQFIDLFDGQYNIIQHTKRNPVGTSIPP